MTRATAVPWKRGICTMPKAISCGTLILNQHHQLLLAHATGRGYWDIPKGLPNPGEAPLAAAVRETAEETGIVLQPERLKDLGIFAYLPGKDLHLFLIHVDVHAIDLKACRCGSFFADRFGRQRPEVDDFRWAGWDEVPALCTKRMAAALEASRPFWGARGLSPGANMSFGHL